MLQINQLHPWARWITPIQEKWRYDTYFYIAVDHVEESAHDQVQHDSEYHNNIPSTSSFLTGLF